MGNRPLIRPMRPTAAAKSADNCVAQANANQADADADDVGDACDPHPLLFDPSGWFYDLSSGEIRTGGTISVSPAAGAIVIADGAAGFYRFDLTTLGTYTISVDPPPGCWIAPTCPPQPGAYDPVPPGPDSLGSTEDPLRAGYLAASGASWQPAVECTANPHYYEITIDSLTDADVLNNNIPVLCSSGPAQAPALSSFALGAAVLTLLGVALRSQSRASRGR